MPSFKCTSMKNFKPLQVIIILGPPGSGKGTQSELLAEKTGLYHLEASEVIVENLAQAKEGDSVSIEGEKYYLLEEKKIREAGGLMSPVLVAYWTKKKIMEVYKKEWGIIFSGNPRTVAEAKALIPFLENLYGNRNIRIFWLRLRPQFSIFRNSHRKTCKLLRHPVLYSKETVGLKKCPLDGSELIVRKDDNSEVVKRRLKEYRERTLPLINYFKSKKLKIDEVNGEKTVAEVFSSLFEKLEK